MRRIITAARVAYLSVGKTKVVAIYNKYLASLWEDDVFVIDLVNKINLKRFEVLLNYYPIIPSYFYPKDTSSLTNYE